MPEGKPKKQTIPDEVFDLSDWETEIEESDPPHIKVFKQVRELHTEMRPPALQVVKASSYDSVLNPTWEENIQRYIFDRLSKFKDNEWKAVNEVYTQTNTTPEMWDNYKLFFDKATLPEQKQMAKAGKPFRDRWREFKEALRSRRQNGTKEANEGQSRRTGPDTNN